MAACKVRSFAITYINLPETQFFIGPIFLKENFWPEGVHLQQDFSHFSDSQMK